MKLFDVKEKWELVTCIGGKEFGKGEETATPSQKGGGESWLCPPKIYSVAIAIRVRNRSRSSMQLRYRDNHRTLMRLKITKSQWRYSMTPILMKTLSLSPECHYYRSLIASREQFAGYSSSTNTSRGIGAHQSTFNYFSH